MIDRCLELTNEFGVAAVVSPQSWLFAPRYKQFRQEMLTDVKWLLMSRLGTGAFETISGEIVNVALLMFEKREPAMNSAFFELDCQDYKTVLDKSSAVISAELVRHSQSSQLPESVSKYHKNTNFPIEINHLACM
jgi:hypothetical protein